MRGSEKSILKKLKKIGHKRFDDHASKLLFKYCLGANSFYHGLGKGLDLPVLKGTRVTRDPIVNNINIAFLKEERGSGIFLPKEERLHRIDVSSYNWFLEKHFNPDDFEIDENFLEDEIYHYSVNDNDYKNYITEKSEVDFHLISISLIYKQPFITMLVQEGTDLKNFYSKILTPQTSSDLLGRNLAELDTDQGMRNLKTALVDQDGAKRDLATRITLAKFDWNKLSKIVPEEERQAYQDCIEWYETRYPLLVFYLAPKIYPQTHLKRWIWLPKYFNFYIRKKNYKPPTKRGVSPKPWTRKNWSYSKEKKVPVLIVYTPKNLKNRIQKRIRVEGELKETRVLGHWRKTPNPLTIGKDKDGLRSVQGRTFVQSFTKMIWCKGERISVKMPFKNILP